MAEECRKSTAFPADQETDGRARAAAYRYLASRDRSREEVARRLRRRGFPEGVIEKTVEDLTRMQYLDDVRFARNWVRIRREQKGYGRDRLRQELAAKGLEKELIEEALGNNPEAEAEAARRLLDKRLRSDGPLSPQQRQRAYRFLRQRGYPPEVVGSTLIRWGRDEEAD